MYSRELIRKETGDFLDGQQKSASFHMDSQNQYYTQVDVGNGQEPIQAKSLTGAYPVILPMEIATVGQDGRRIDFTMLINPESWNHGKTNSYHPVYTRAGWVLQLWGPNQDTISSTGTSAAMMTPNGLDNYLKSMSFGYLNLMALVSSYKTNGYSFFDPNDARAATRVINTISGVQIYFDGTLMLGHFNNFTIDEDSEHPFIFHYNFDFIISDLNGGQTEIRGHYKKLPPATAPTIGALDPSNSITLLDDVYNESPALPLMPPRPVDDATTTRLWERITGLPWAEAINNNLTDGSVQGNLRLRQNLYTKKWNPQTKKFE